VHILTFLSTTVSKWRWGSSVRIVSGYGLDNRVIQDLIPGRVRDFSSNLCVQTGSEAYPASCTMGTGGPFPRGKARLRRDTDHSTPTSAIGVLGDCFTFFTVNKFLMLELFQLNNSCSQHCGLSSMMLIS
jgi:hypothetical protein